MYAALGISPSCFIVHNGNEWFQYSLRIYLFISLLIWPDVGIDWLVFLSVLEGWFQLSTSPQFPTQPTLTLSSWCCLWRSHQFTFIDLRFSFFFFMVLRFYSDITFIGYHHIFPVNLWGFISIYALYMSLVSVSLLVMKKFSYYFFMSSSSFSGSSWKPDLLYIKHFDVSEDLPTFHPFVSFQLFSTEAFPSSLNFTFAVFSIS